MLIEIKAVFARSLAKINPTQEIAQQPLPVNKQTELSEANVDGSLAKTQTNQDIAQEKALSREQLQQKATKILEARAMKAE